MVSYASKLSADDQLEQVPDLWPPKEWPVPPGCTLRGGDPDERETLRRSIRLAVTVGQIFSALPVSSATGAEPRFRWLSLRVLYAVSVGVSFAVRLCLRLKTHLWDGNWNSERDLVPLVFWTCPLATELYFLNLARKWVTFLQGVEAAEERLFCTFGTRPRMWWRLNLTCVFCLVIVLGEHLVFIVIEVLALQESSPNNLLQTFFTFRNPDIASLVHPYYSHVLLILCELHSWMVKLLYSYGDIFLILLCSALSEYFRMMNEGLLSAVEQGRVKTRAFWRNLRETYSDVARAVSEKDEELGYLMILSFSSNLVIICFLLLQTVNRSSPLNFLPSLCYLALRVVAVSLSAASVHDRGSRVKEILYSVSPASYNVEVQRFLVEATTRNVTLSGLKFFNITRSFILTVVGTIITYEIVLLQINDVHK